MGSQRYGTYGYGAQGSSSYDPSVQRMYGAADQYGVDRALDRYGNPQWPQGQSAGVYGSNGSQAYGQYGQQAYGGEGNWQQRGPQQGQVHQRDGRQPARRQQALQAAFQRGDALLEDEGGGRAVQAVGVAFLLLPLAGAQRGDVGEVHRGRLVHRHLRRVEVAGRTVGVVDELGRGACHRFIIPADLEPPARSATASAGPVRWITRRSPYRRAA